MIQTITKQTSCQASVLFDEQRLMLIQPFTHDMCPTEGQRQQCQQFLEPRGIGDMRLFQAEAATLQTPEKSFHLPALRVVSDGAFSLTLRDDDQVFAFWQSHPADGPAMSPDKARPSEHQWLIEATLPEQLPGLHHLPSCVGNQGVSSHPDATRDAFAPQVGEPLFANKLALSAQISDSTEAKQASELIEQSAALSSVRAALLFEDR